MDDLKLLSHMRSNVPPPTLHALTAAERRLAQAAASPRRSPLRALTAGRPAGRRPLGRLVIAGGLAMAVAAGAAFAAQSFESGRTTPASTGHVQLTAWTVTRLPDGLVKIRVRELRNATGLAAQLRREGIPIGVEFVRHRFQVTTSPRDIPRYCVGSGLPDEPAAKLLSRISPQYPPPDKNGISRSIPGVLFVIKPSAIPHGIGLFFKVYVPADPRLNGAGGQWELNLVRTTEACTG